MINHSSVSAAGSTARALVVMAVLLSIVVSGQQPKPYGSQSNPRGQTDSSPTSPRPPVPPSPQYAGTIADYFKSLGLASSPPRSPSPPTAPRPPLPGDPEYYPIKHELGQVYPNLQPKTDETWRAIHDKVFANTRLNPNEPKMEPMELRLALVLLQDVYFSKYWNNLRAGNIEASGRWWAQLNRIASLLKASLVSVDRCNAHTTREFNVLIAMSQNNDLNLLPYLNHFRNFQSETCKQFGNEMVQSSVATQLSQGDVVRMDRLAGLVRENLYLVQHTLDVRTNERDPNLNVVLAQSIAQFLKELLPEIQQAGPSHDPYGVATVPTSPRRMSKDEFMELFDEHIIYFCRRISHSVAMVEHIADVEGVYPDLVQSSFDWVVNANMCTDILHVKKEIDDMAYNYFKSTGLTPPQSPPPSQPQSPPRTTYGSGARQGVVPPVQVPRYRSWNLRRSNMPPEYPPESPPRSGQSSTSSQYSYFPDRTYDTYL